MVDALVSGASAARRASSSLVPGTRCGSSSVGRASASQAEGRGFEPRLPLTLVLKSECFLYGKRLVNLRSPTLIFLTEKNESLTTVLQVVRQEIIK